MHWYAIAFIYVSLAVTVVLEIATGRAVTAWSAQRMIVDRATSPRTYWFTVTVHVVILSAIPPMIFWALRSR